MSLILFPYVPACITLIHSGLAPTVETVLLLLCLVYSRRRSLDRHQEAGSPATVLFLDGRTLPDRGFRPRSIFTTSITS
jgi:hypothetical protein